jgi:Fe2+ transport system protein FeoA
MHRCCKQTQSEDLNLPAFPLALASEGERVRIVFLPCGNKARERLLSMGIALEDEVQVVQKQAGGAMLIEKNGTRYALGGGMALKINVMKC